MLSDPLPNLVLFNDYDGDWFSYLEAIYQHYLSQVANANLLYNNLPVRCKFVPLLDGKGFAFWHAISEGEEEENRQADLRRCERICWIGWMIRNASTTTGKKITWWQNKRGSNVHIVLFLEEESYVVVLAKRNGYYLFKTAYCANPQRKMQLIRERNRYWST